MKKLKELYLKMLPKKWRNKNGVGTIIFIWVICIPSFEVFWLFSGVTDLWAILGMPAFFLVLTLAITKWALRLF